MSQHKQAILDSVQALGTHQIAYIDMNRVVFSGEVRAACAQNRCGKYDTCWTCPPACGEVAELQAMLLRYPHALLFSTVTKLMDSYDWEGMTEAGNVHKALTQKASDQIHAYCDAQGIPAKLKVLGAGACAICELCAYPQAPCRFPDRAHVSMEASGISVVDICNTFGLNYINGRDTVTYFSMIMIDAQI